MFAVIRWLRLLDVRTPWLVRGMRVFGARWAGSIRSGRLHRRDNTARTSWSSACELAREGAASTGAPLEFSFRPDCATTATSCLRLEAPLNHLHGSRHFSLRLTSAPGRQASQNPHQRQQSLQTVGRAVPDVHDRACQLRFGGLIGRKGSDSSAAFEARFPIAL